MGQKKNDFSTDFGLSLNSPIEVKPKEKDWVAAPDHYAQLKEKLGGKECWDVYTLLLRHKPRIPGFLATFWQNCFKYLWRIGDKPGDYGKTDEEKMCEDMCKVMEYAAKFIIEAGGKIPDFSHIQYTGD